MLSALFRSCPHTETVCTSPFLLPRFRCLRSDASLEAIAEAIEARTPRLVLYNYPSFSGAVSALFAQLFHSQLKLPCLILPFSSVLPFRVDDFCFEGLKECYFLDFIGPPGFVLEISRRTGCKVTCFDHRKSTVPRSPDICTENLKFHVNLDKSSARASFEYFSGKFELLNSPDKIGDNKLLIGPDDYSRVDRLLQYIEDGDLRRWSLPDIQAFNIGIREWQSEMSCLTNHRLFEQLLRIDCDELIAKGKSYILSRWDASKHLLDKAFKLRLGRGLYGECLAVRADGHANLVDEIGKQLCLRSAAAGLRPIGAVVYMQRNNLKMSLRSADSCTDTTEIAKAYGGGGSSKSSSFIIRMDEYNLWRSNS